MKNNELSPTEKLNLAIQSHKFYNEQCVTLEKKINVKIDTIFQTEEAGKNIKKKDIAETVEMVNKLLTLSHKYMREGVNVVSELDTIDVSEIEEDFAEVMKKQLTAMNVKQQQIHDRVEEIQEMLIEMYNVDEDDTF